VEILFEINNLPATPPRKETSVSHRKIDLKSNKKMLDNP